MRREPHPFSGFEYTAVEGGKVRVEDHNSGRYGLFHWDGTWLEGELTHADPHFLLFIGGPDLAPDDDVIWTRLRLTEDEATPPDGYLFGRLPEGFDRVVGRYDPAPPAATEQGPRAAAHIDIDYFLDNDRNGDSMPSVYRRSAPMSGGPQRVTTDRFFDPAYHAMEVEHIWRRVWQVACREDDIPNVGDYHVYTVADLSWLIVRVGPNEIRAHQNVCLHRGRILRECDGKHATEFRCPYHGWSWKLDGSVKDIVCEWDFPGVREDVSQLPGAKVGTWGGWVFINPDADAGSLEDFLGPEMIAQYERFDHASFWKQAHVTRPMPANWKVAMEAFMEGWHVLATHPQLLLLGWEDAADRYDVFGNWGRGGHVTTGRGSAQRNILYDKEQLLAEYHMTADSSREYHRNILGDEVDKFSDAELNDNSYCDLFPNFHPWAGFSRINFRFRPFGNDPNRSLMDVILLAPWPKGKEKPPAAKQRMLGDSESWTNAPEIGTLGRIIDQDIANMTSVQAGLKAKHPNTVWYSAYQEGKIRNFHQNYGRWMGLKEDDGQAQ